MPTTTSTTRRRSSTTGVARPGGPRGEKDPPPPPPPGPPRRRRRRDAIPPTLVPPLEPLEEIYQALVLGTRDYVRKTRFRDVVVGLSGGIDSALVTALPAEGRG